MTAPFDVTTPLPGAAFGATVRLARPLNQEMPQGLPQALAEAGGLLLIRPRSSRLSGRGSVRRTANSLLTASGNSRRIR